MDPKTVIDAITIVSDDEVVVKLKNNNQYQKKISRSSGPSDRYFSTYNLLEIGAFLSEYFKKQDAFQHTGIINYVQYVLYEASPPGTLPSHEELAGAILPLLREWNKSTSAQNSEKPIPSEVLMDKRLLKYLKKAKADAVNLP